jgi:polyisoprenoid-binding protein YceI
MNMNTKKLTNLKAKTIPVKATRTKTTIFGALGAVLLATIAISAMSSAVAPAEAARQGTTHNTHSHTGCSSGNGGCGDNKGSTTNFDDYHKNENCNIKRAVVTDYCKTNENIR